MKSRWSFSFFARERTVIDLQPAAKDNDPFGSSSPMPKCCIICDSIQQSQAKIVLSMNKKLKTICMFKKVV